MRIEILLKEIRKEKRI